MTTDQDAPNEACSNPDPTKLESKNPDYASVGEARDRAADERDMVSVQRDRVADERDEVGEHLDQVADDRDLLGEQRDRAGVDRDREARRRDRSADQRDLAADRRDRMGEEQDRAISALGVEGSAGAASVAEPKRTAADRKRGADDRHAAARERWLAAVDRETAAVDRAGAARERTQARRDRADSFRARGAGATERTSAEEDRDTAMADRSASARDRASASHDGLTGVYLRAPGFEELERDMLRARRTGELFTLAFVDVDGLKAVNDSEGHAAGDQVLVEVAGALASGLRSYDLIVRYGGDEFVCALLGVGKAEAAKRFEVVNRALAATARQPSVTVGFAEMRRGDVPDDLVARADDDLYRRRESNRPTVP